MKKIVLKNRIDSLNALIENMLNEISEKDKKLYNIQKKLYKLSNS